MPKLSRGAGPVGLALTAVDVWRRLSPRQRRVIMGQAKKQAKKYGPRVAEQALRSARTAAASLRARGGK